MKNYFLIFLACIIVFALIVQPIPTFANTSQIEISASAPTFLTQTVAPLGPDHEIEDRQFEPELVAETQRILEEHLREEGLPEKLLSYEKGSNFQEKREYVTPSDKVVAQTKAQVDSFSCADVTDVLESECEALVALYESTNGAGWDDNSNWLVTITVSEWYGVTVESGHIDTMDLTDNNLIGSIPQELGNLSNLQRVWLAGNQLSGNIPPELGNLSNLYILDLSWNQLSSSIPQELGNLSNLYYLSLGVNQLSGRIPLTFTNLVLDSFYFSSTYLCEPDVPEFLAWKATVPHWQGTDVVCKMLYLPVTCK